LACNGSAVLGTLERALRLTVSSALGGPTAGEVVSGRPGKANRTYTGVGTFCFVLIILCSLYLEYDSPLIPSASGLAG
jgi:hypothetical protein